MLKEKFSNNCAWEEPEWTTSMNREDFDKKCKHEKGRGDMDVSEDTKCGIYSKKSTWLNEIDDHWMSKIDLEQVNLNLRNTVEYGSTYHPLQNRVMINFTKEACDRGRELKLQK